MNDTDAPIGPVLLVGCGRMGSAMLAGWRESGLAGSFAIDPADGAARLGGSDLEVVANMAAIPADFRPAAVVFAIKPQMATEALPAFRDYAGSAVFLSIMAGRTITSMSDALGSQAAFVRAMPNTPAAIRQGITVACPNARVVADQRELCDRLLRAIGEVAWVDDESLLDPVTATSGSGPAYVFLLAELMEQAGVEQGLPADLARRLARQTVAGSGALLASSSEPAAALREAVTSPGGTTAAALRVLMEPSAWPATLHKAIAAATARSRELAG